MVAGPTTVKLAAGVEPKLIAVAAVKPEPEIVTDVPPADGTGGWARAGSRVGAVSGARLSNRRARRC